MAIISETLTTPHEIQLRLFDPRRDLEPVADLIELCFGDTLDRDGREYLRRMRSAAKGASWLNWAAQAEWTQPAMGGYVWQQGGRLQGNVSLIPYFVNRRRFFLIANVAVHPEYRRRGIARQLTQQAIQHARLHGSPSVWLHVRDDNPGAINLYIQLGFIERARRTNWIATSDAQVGELQPGERISIPGGQNWGKIRSWMLRDYPPELSWHMPLRLNCLNPGFFGEISRFLNSLTIQQWSLLINDRLAANAAGSLMSGNAGALWLAAAEETEPRQILALVSALRKFLPPARHLMLDYPANRYDTALRSAGMTPSQTLIWMEKVLS